MDHPRKISGLLFPGTNNFFKAVPPDIPTYVRSVFWVFVAANFLLFFLVSYKTGFSLTGLSTQLANIVKYGVPLLLIAWCSGLVLAAGQVDISLGAVATLGGIIFAIFSKNNQYFGFATCMLVGCAFGAINGYAVSYRKAPALLMTWSTSVIAAGSSALIVRYYSQALEALGGKGSSLDSIELDWLPISSNMFHIGSFYFGSFILISALIAVLITFSRLGGFARLVGASPITATYYGFKADRILFYVYIFGGCIACVAGMLNAIAFGNASTTSMVDKSLICIAIAVLGGTVMSGGYFSIYGITIALILWIQIEYVFWGSVIPLPSWLQMHENRISLMIFSLIIITISFLFGRKLSGLTRTIQVDDPRQTKDII